MPNVIIAELPRSGISSHGVLAGRSASGDSAGLLTTRVLFGRCRQQRAFSDRNTATGDAEVHRAVGKRLVLDQQGLPRVHGLEELRAPDAPAAAAERRFLLQC